jgi:hypothetical protein
MPQLATYTQNSSSRSSCSPRRMLVIIIAALAAVSTGLWEVGTISEAITGHPTDEVFRAPKSQTTIGIMHPLSLNGLSLGKRKLSRVKLQYDYDKKDFEARVFKKRELTISNKPDFVNGGIPKVLNIQGRAVEVQRIEKEVKMMLEQNNINIIIKHDNDKTVTCHSAQTDQNGNIVLRDQAQTFASKMSDAWPLFYSVLTAPPRLTRLVYNADHGEEPWRFGPDLPDVRRMEPRMRAAVGYRKNSVSYVFYL